MKHKNFYSLYAVLAAMFAFMLPVTSQAQENDVLTLKLNAPFYHNNVEVTEDDGVFTVYTTGGDPYVTIDGITRDLRDDERALTFEYKSDQDAGVEIFFSTSTGNSYAAGYSLVLGTAPATDDWERVTIDLATPIDEWKWGKKDYTMRLDPGNDAGIIFQLRNIQITNTKIDGADLSKYNFTLNEDGAIQINKQEDFDNWTKACNDFISSLYVPLMTVDLNTDVVAKTTGGCFVENFRGVFDGHGHKITFDAKNETESFGSGLIRYLEGTVKNLALSGTIEGNGMHIGPLAMDLNTSGVAENIYSDVTIISHTKSEVAYHGGIFARMPGGVLRNAVFAGKICNPDGVTSGCGGIAGNSGNISQTILENIIMAGDLSEVAEGSNTIHTDVNSQATNVFATSEASATPEWCEIIAAEALASGRFCFMLNGDQKNIVWYQTLGEDAWPVMDKTHKQVYGDGPFNCDGTPLSGKITYNNEGGAEVPEHNYENGICVNCGHKQEGYVDVLDLQQDEEGYYLITSGEDFMAFARGVNGGDFRKANARMTDDVDLSGYEYIPIGWTTECYNKGAAINEIGYAGIFDGQGHVVYNATAVNEPAFVTSGIFGTVTGTVRNLGVSGYTWVNAYSGRHGGLVGSLVDGLVENCYVIDSRIEHTSAGEIVSGLAGTNCGGTIRNCYEYNNSINNYPRAGMLVGDNQDDNGARKGKVINCYSQQFVTGEGRSGGYGGGKTNCEDHVSAERFESGEIAYKLNGSTFSTNPVWRQEIGNGSPVMDPEMPIIVVTLSGTVMNVSATDGLTEFCAAIAEEELTFLDENTCQTELAARYAELIEQLEGELTAETFTPILEEMTALRAQVVSSAAAYASYEEKIAEISAYLEEHTDFEGEGRDLLTTYLTETIEPDSTQFPNGSYLYITENLLLNEESLSNEKAFAQELLDKAIATGYMAGADVTNLIVNADFSNGANGWTNNGLSITNVADIAVKHVGENGARLELSQTLENLRPGLYEITAYAAYRADGYNQSYAQNSFVFAGENKVYTTTLPEGMMPTDVENADKFTAITDIEENIIGYLPTNGTQMAHAYSAGLYKHTVVAEVGEDGTLTIGVSTPGGETANQTWVGPFAMTFCGEATSDLAAAAIDRMLACQTERLTALSEKYPTYVEENNNYKVAPNYPAALKDKVAQAIASVASAEDKLAKAKELSDLMQEVYDAKEAYIAMMNKAELLQMISSEMFVAGLIDEAEAAKLDEAYINMVKAYFEGTYSADEALAYNPFEGTTFMPAIVDNTVQITNAVELTMFSAMVNGGMAEGLNAVLKNDIDMSAITFYPPIGYADQDHLNGAGGDITVPGFQGVFDGQGYSIKNLTAPYNSTYASSGVFGNNSGTIRNLIVDGYTFQFGDNAAYKGRHGALCGQNFGLIENCAVVNSIVNHTGEIVSAITAGNYNGTVRACFENQNNIATYSRAGKLIGDNRDDNTFRVGYAETCFSASNVIGDFAGNSADCHNNVKTFAGGEVAYLLNQANEGHPECLTWKQNIGEDASPVLDQTHKTVYAIEGGYSNYQGVNHELYLANQKAKNMLKTITFVGGEGEALITDGSQLSANCQWQGFTPAMMADGDLNTYFHSNADAAGQSQFNAGEQWMQVDLNTEVAGFYMEYSGRGDGAVESKWHDTPNKIRILATNTPADESSWKEITIVEYPEIPNQNNAYFKNTEPIMLGGAYKHIRFNILRATSNNSYWNVTEFQLYSASTSTTSYYDEHPEVQGAADALKALSDAADEKLAAASATEQDVADLKAAIAALRALIPASVIPYDGTKDEPLQIATAEELTKLRKQLKKGQTTYVVLTADIDMAEVTEWTPLNTASEGYENYIDFDGQGHVIRNFTCTDATQSYNSFFGILCGDVRNVGFENATVTSTATGTGILAGYMGHETYKKDGALVTSTLYNVWVSGKVEAGTGYVGGLIGNIGGPSYIKNVYANVEVAGGADYQGGLVGRVRDQLTILNAYAAGTVAKGGGIVGGGQKEETTAGVYQNIVVWNNTDQNFGPIREGIDATENITYFDGNNFAALQGVVVAWGAPWACDMAEGSYPTFDMTTGIQGVTNSNAKGKIYNINGIQVEKTTKGLYIIDGKKVMVK